MYEYILILLYVVVSLLFCVARCLGGVRHRALMFFVACDTCKRTVCLYQICVD
jgi:hypothetical protein